MTERTDPRSTLSELETEIVEYVVRFGVLVPALFAAANNRPAESVRKTADGLTRTLLSRHKSPTDGRAAYYVLSPAGAYQLGVKAPPKTGYTDKGLLHRVMVAAYVAQAGLTKLNPSEFVAHFEDLCWPRANISHYVIDLAASQLGWVVVDDGERDQKRLASKVREEHGRRYAIRAWREGWILPGRFFISVLTSADAKAAQIRALLDERPVRYTAVRVVSLEAVLDLIPVTSGG